MFDIAMILGEPQIGHPSICEGLKYLRLYTIKVAKINLEVVVH